MNINGDHSVWIHLAPEVRSAVIAYCHKHDLDKPYALQCLIVKQLRSEGLLSDVAYNFYLPKYSKTVSSMSHLEDDLREQSRPKTLEELKIKQKLDEKTRYFQMVLEQWHLHPSKEWRSKVLASAVEWANQIEQARLVLDLSSNGSVQTHQKEEK